MRKLWLAFAAVLVLSFAVLGWTGLRIYQEAPPVPTRVVTAEGRQVIGTDEIHGGQNVWQFMSNPPIALCYMQGLNTTPVHAHAALVGVYGMLGIGLMLFSLRALDPVPPWREGLVTFGFWATNAGLFAMVTFSLLPVGVMQTWASVEIGYWYARSPEFLQTGAIETFRWLRVIGDTIFAAGAVALAVFVIGLRTGGSTGREPFDVGEPASVRGQS